MKNPSILAWLFVTLASGAPAAAQEPAGLDEVVRGEMQRQKIPGVAVAVVKAGAVLAAKGYGEANVEHHVPVTADTIFESGSLGKQFTAAAVMLLAEDGRIGLDDPIAKYFPDAPVSWKSIAVHHLLTHTSGIPDYTDDALDLRRDYSEEELAQLAYRMRLEFPPGSRWNYSNTGYVLLGAIVRRAGGRFYGDVLRDRVFGPIGMQNARIISEADLVPNRAAGYQLVKGELKNQDWVSPSLNTTADGSLYLSLRDLVAWDRALRARALLKPASWALVWTPVKLTSGASYPYGFGWGIHTEGGRTVHEHGGAWQGFKTYLARYLDDDLTVIVLANLAQAEPDRIAEKVAALIDPALASPEPAPIPAEPALVARLQRVLAAAAAGTLTNADAPYVRAGSLPEARTVAALGTPGRIDLLRQETLGDDRVSTFDVVFPTKTMRVTLGLAPDDKVSILRVAPRPD